MIKNYFKTAWRSLQQNKLLSFVNIAGLSIGLTCLMLILLFVKDEWSFDKFHKNGSNIYRLVQTTTDTSGKERRSGNTGMPHGPVFAAEVPEIENFCRIKGWEMTTKRGTEGILSTVLFADPSVFKIFTLDVLKGNEAEMLKGRNSVVMTQKAAEKYFGNENPLGKIVEIEVDESFEPFMVTGVVKSMPLNSSLQFDMLIPFERQNPGNIAAAEMNSQMNNWHNLYLNTFFLLRKGTDVKQAEQKLWPVYLKHNGDEWDKSKKRGGTAGMKYTLQPFFSIHLDQDFHATNGLSNWSDAKYSYILSGLAVLILIIACINFINIALARSLQRSKEIGVRKVTGSSKWQMILQFLSESFLVTAISFFAALLLVQLAIPVFNNISGKHFSFAYIIQPVTIGIFIALILAVSFLAGFYPAFVASRFQPVQTSYGRFKLSGKNITGKLLVVLQFVIAVVLIISTIMFNRQFNYISHTELGYNPKDMLHLRFPWGKPADLRRFKNELEQNPAIQSVGTKSGNWNKSTFEINGKRTDWTYYEHIDDNYLQVMQIPLVKGRYLNYTNPSDTVLNCMVNEAFAEAYLDKAKDPVGQLVNSGGNKNPLTVVGIVKNYHSANLKEKIEPIFFELDKWGDLLNTYIKYIPGQKIAAAEALIKTYKKILPYSSLEYFNMEDWLMQKYEEDAQWKKVVSFCALIAVLISALGLFALTSLSVQQRVKEIGIRKVLGATVYSIGLIISKDFLTLVVIAVVIASPIAWWAMDKWLQNFAYRVNFSWWVFAIAGFAALLIALLTVSYQSIKAALMNPVKSLKTE